MKTPINIYDAAYLTILPAAAAMMGYKMLTKGKYRESAPAMLGFNLKNEDPSKWQNGSVWVHAVSVGEVIAARAMLPLLKEYFAPLPVLLTTHTETGQSTARSLPTDLTDAVRYYPLDLSWIVQNFVNVFRPKVFIPMETELWPNALNIIAKSGARIFTLNGKISEKSFKSYQKINNIISQPLSKVTAFCVQTELDRNRIAGLLGRDDHIHVTGNCKFDIQTVPMNDNEKVVLAEKLGLPWQGRLVVAGSTHAGEEEIILKAMNEVWKHSAEINLAIVPRHPERFQEVWNMLKQSPIPALRISSREQSGSGPIKVFLIDQMGVLTQLYGLAEVAVVAGSFAPGIGGHNILEPASHRVPVIYGPDMKGQPDMARILSPNNGGTLAPPDMLGSILSELLQNREMRLQKGDAGFSAVLANQGAAFRNMTIIQQYMEAN